MRAHSRTLEIVFWVGEDLETFLVKPLAAVPKTARVIKLAEAPGVVLLGSRAERYAGSRMCMLAMAGAKMT